MAVWREKTRWSWGEHELQEWRSACTDWSVRKGGAVVEEECREWNVKARRGKEREDWWGQTGELRKWDVLFLQSRSLSPPSQSYIYIGFLKAVEKQRVNGVPVDSHFPAKLLLDISGSMRCIVSVTLDVAQGTQRCSVWHCLWLFVGSLRGDPHQQCTYTRLNTC